MPTVLTEAARRAEPSALRAAATVGGSVALGGPDERVPRRVARPRGVGDVGRFDGERVIALAALILDLTPLGGRIITSVSIETGGVSASVRTGRTGADRPIVAAVARRDESGMVHLAMTGVAATPVLVEDVEDLDPPGDFLGSGEYRARARGHPYCPRPRGGRLMDVYMTLNGPCADSSARRGTRCSRVLRREGCFSVRFGSETGETGAAAVLLDGRLVSADVSWPPRPTVTR